jgi:hypothetical protein
LCFSKTGCTRYVLQCTLTIQDHLLQTERQAAVSEDGDSTSQIYAGPIPDTTPERHSRLLRSDCVNLDIQT